jgi:hypothetical protein
MVNRRRLVGAKRTCLCVNARRQESRFIGEGEEVRKQGSKKAMMLLGREARRKRNILDMFIT